MDINWNKCFYYENVAQKKVYQNNYKSLIISIQFLSNRCLRIDSLYI
jgi:hypothetical protein